MGGGGKAPEPTAEQLAMQRQQREALDKEKAASERRLKSIAQKKIGKASLLGRPVEQAKGPAGRTITKGFQNVGGNIRSDRGAYGLMARFVNSDFGKAAFGQAAMGQGIGKKAATGSLLGKSGDKAAKSATKAVTK